MFSRRFRRMIGRITSKTQNVFARTGPLDAMTVERGFQEWEYQLEDSEFLFVIFAEWPSNLPP